MKQLFSGLILGAVLATGAAAQGVPQDLWREEMAALEFLSGEFAILGEAMTQDGWAQGSEVSGSAGYELEGAAMVERSAFDTPVFSSNLTSTFTYDGFRNVYRVGVVDDVYGLLDVHEGGFTEDGRMVLTNRRVGTSFPLQDGREMFIRFTLVPGEGGHVALFDVAIDDSEEWQPLYRVTYTRVGD